MTTAEELHAYRHRRSRQKHSGCISMLVLLIGIGISLVFWPVGIPICLLALVIDGQRDRYHICGYCGNQLTATARICPTCKATLHKEPFWSPRRFRMIVTSLILLAILIASISILATQVPPP